MLQKVVSICMALVLMLTVNNCLAQLPMSLSFDVMAPVDSKSMASNFISTPLLLSANSKCLSVSNGVAVLMEKPADLFKSVCAIDEFSGRDIKIQSYPNPAKTETVLKTSSLLFTETPVSLQLTNQQGSIVLVLSTKSNQLSAGQKIDLRNTPAGIYFIQVIRDNQLISSTKLIVVK